MTTNTNTNTIHCNIEQIAREIAADFSLREVLCRTLGISMLKILENIENPMDCRPKSGERALIWQTIRYYTHNLCAENYDEVLSICSLRPLGALNLVMPEIISAATNGTEDIYLLRLLRDLLEICPDRIIIDSAIEKIFGDTKKYKLDVLKALISHQD